MIVAESPGGHVDVQVTCSDQFLEIDVYTTAARPVRPFLSPL